MSLGSGWLGAKKCSSTCMVYKQWLVALAHANHPAQLLQPPPQHENHVIALPDQWKHVRWGCSSDLASKTTMVHSSSQRLKLAALDQGLAIPRRFSVIALPSSLRVTTGGLGTMVRMLSCCRNQDNQAYIGTKGIANQLTQQTILLH